MMRPSDREQIMADLRLDRQARCRALDPEAYDAYWAEHAKQVNGSARIKPKTP